MGYSAGLSRSLPSYGIYIYNMALRGIVQCNLWFLIKGRLSFMSGFLIVVHISRRSTFRSKVLGRTLLFGRSGPEDWHPLEVGNIKLQFLMPSKPKTMFLCRFP